MENIWNEMYSAAKAVLDPRKISDIVEAGGRYRSRFGKAIYRRVR